MSRIYYTGRLDYSKPPSKSAHHNTKEQRSPNDSSGRRQSMNSSSPSKHGESNRRDSLPPLRPTAENSGPLAELIEEDSFFRGLFGLDEGWAHLCVCVCVYMYIYVYTWVYHVSERTDSLCLDEGSGLVGGFFEGVQKGWRVCTHVYISVFLLWVSMIWSCFLESFGLQAMGVRMCVCTYTAMIV
jgi:hypothetical protein